MLPDPGYESGDELGLINRLTQIALDHLTMPDTMAMVSGNWQCLDRLHTPFREAIIEEGLEGEDSEVARDELADELAGCISDVLTAEDVAETLRQLRRDNGEDLVEGSIRCIRTHIRDAVDVILGSDEEIARDGAPASARLQRITDDTLGELIDYLSQQVCHLLHYLHDHYLQ